MGAATLLLVGSGTAAATTFTVAQVTPAGVPFGLLGPVGLIAVIGGVSGMLLGLARSARKRRSEQSVGAFAGAGQAAGHASAGGPYTARSSDRGRSPAI
ncbi:hypothetical protein [Haloechinothrix sp. LS1_15]|uniref:hypothetical protein n=1 Tax=Haloechinothrix sp. LS1_15 TaxID=2652248 RepID=UPI00294B09A5|nr:hypothetical protein [Haloechinothrix sp. LS1_15]